MRMKSSGLFRRKNVEQLIHEMNSSERLNRRLGPLALTGLGVGATIGTGIYVLIGEVAKDTAGPALMLSFLLAAIGCGFAALCYSELASMVPVAGSALYVCLHDPGRDRRLDHRLGLDPGIRHRLECCRRRLVEVSRLPAAKRAAYSS